MFSAAFDGVWGHETGIVSSRRQPAVSHRHRLCRKAALQRHRHQKRRSGVYEIHGNGMAQLTMTTIDGLGEAQKAEDSVAQFGDDNHISLCTPVYSSMRRQIKAS